MTDDTTNTSRTRPLSRQVRVPSWLQITYYVVVIWALLTTMPSGNVWVFGLIVMTIVGTSWLIAWRLTLPRPGTAAGVTRWEYIRTYPLWMAISLSLYVIVAAPLLAVVTILF